MNRKTAILIFAQTAATATQAKAIGDGNTLFDVLNEQTLKTVQQTGLPYFVSNEYVQEGDSFGSRFVNAFQSVFDAGFDRVIAVGNDTPHLNTQHILKAAIVLDNQSLVLGPSLDGGFYLLGLNRSAFDAQELLSLPWQSRQLTNALLKCFSYYSQEDVVLLPQLIDIDSLDDVFLIKKFLFSFSLKRIIKQVILLLTETTFDIPCHYQGSTGIYHQAIPTNKGSPLAA